MRVLMKISKLTTQPWQLPALTVDHERQKKAARVSLPALCKIYVSLALPLVQHLLPTTAKACVQGQQTTGVLVLTKYYIFLEK